MNQLNVNEETTDSTTDSLKETEGAQVLVDFIIQCPAIFRSQQIKDPDLGLDEKKKIAEDLLLNKPLTFLIRFGRYLKEEHLNYFINTNKANYEVLCYVKNLKKQIGESKKNLIKKNRRFEAMKRMEENGTYFSEKEMEERNPVLYHYMVGQYLNDQEKFSKYKEYNANVIPTFSNFLIEKLEREELNELLKHHSKEENDYRLSSEPTKKNNKIELSETNDNVSKKWAADWEDNEICEKTHIEKNVNRKQSLPAKEKAFLYQEFKSYIQSKFLNGDDSDFNYSEVDSNPDYDSLNILGQDEEDRYFDEETCDNNGECTDTGIEDY